MPETKLTPICVITPIFKQSGLAYEAISSFLAQDRAHAHRLVVVDDGCPLPHNLFGLAGLASLHPNITLIRRRNGGLSAARNTGLEFALSAFADVEAFFFLDADNRLSLSSLERFEAALHSSDADWFFPDIEMFGVDDASFDFSGPYSAYLHVLQNVSEAGSLVRRRVFDTGLRFDEDMRLGYEDWDFWLSALSHGFRGTHLPASGFKYRKRSESMVSASARVDTVIKHYLRKKHRWMSNPAVLTSLEHRVCPRYAIVDSLERKVVLCSDPSVAADAITLESYCDLVRRSFAAPNRLTPGTVVVFMAHRLLATCNALKIANWLFIEIERAARSDAAVAFVATDESRPKSGAACIAAVSANQLFAVIDPCGDGQLATIPTSFYESGAIFAYLGDRTGTALHAFDEMANMRDFCRMARAGFPGSSARRRTLAGRPGLHEAPLLARQVFTETYDPAWAAPLPNKAWDRRGKWALVIDTDKHALKPRLACLARGLAGNGCTVDLVALGCVAPEIWDDVRDTFGALHVFAKDSPSRDTTSQGLLANILSSYESVVVTADRALSILAVVRDRGVVTLSLADDWLVSHAGPSSLSLMVSYEHVIDLYFCLHFTTRDHLVALGVPASKIAVGARSEFEEGFEIEGSASAAVEAAEQVIATRRTRTIWNLEIAAPAR